MSNIIKELCAHTIPLYGKHIIEASAGTGKTYNITRLYLRFLLERRLTVEQILVMTFTKDATEELRGRIDESIREAINHWYRLIKEDEYFIALSARIKSDEALRLLKTALLSLDEAAIFTIHGFCKRVLTQQAFSMGMSFNAKMDSDCHGINITACQDWYRILAKNSVDKFTLIATYWQTPTLFSDQFLRAINTSNSLSSLSPEYIIEIFQNSVVKAKNSLLANKTFLFEQLVDVKKGKDRQTRSDEYDDLLVWLSATILEISHANTKMPVGFFDGRRFSRSNVKIELKAIFVLVNEIKATYSKITEKITKAKAYEVVKQGIVEIQHLIKQQKIKQNILSFDDLITTLSQALTTSDNKNELSQHLFEQFPVALVDEFQDTDPHQFAILQAIYYQQAQTALYLIGDPKQAIYGFRGGDVFTYLLARKDCDHQWFMDINWRSSTYLISAYNRLFWGDSLTEQARDVFDHDISYTRVKTSYKGEKLPIIDHHYNALQFIHFTTKTDEKGRVKSTKQSFRLQMSKWCAQEIKRLLTKSDGKRDSLVAKDIAILVRDGPEALEIKTALAFTGLNSVYLSDHENLLKSSQARQLIRVLQGILFVENERLFSAAIASPLMGFNPYRYYQLQQNQQQWQQLKLSFTDLREQWRNKSFISMALMLLHQHFFIEANNKDRILTNLIHLFECLQAASQQHQQAQNLLCWFEQQITTENPELETEIRLESDKDLIKIVTQHGSKGLEYPVVFIPFATRHKDPLKFRNQAVSLITYHDKNKQLQLSLDGSEEAKMMMSSEAYAETVRLLYVAITRAKQRCYILTTAFDNAHNSPLGKTMKWQKDVVIEETLQTLAYDQPLDIGVDIVDDIVLNRYSKPNTEESINQVFQVAEFTGAIERDWWLSSFSALNRKTPHSVISQPDRDNNNSTSSEVLGNSQLLRFKLSKGAKTGNLLHDILEHTDFSVPNWTQVLAKPLRHYADDSIDESQLILWLDDILQTSLDQIVMTDKTTKLTLSTLCFSQTLRECEFYFPMNKAKISQLEHYLTKFRHHYYEQERISKINFTKVFLPSYQKLNGMMHGFIDLIFEYKGKYYLGDYKSSYLGTNFNDYKTLNLLVHIEQNNYDLQYIIYALALHRYLKIRVKNYNIKQHFGGIYYLYLRGMNPLPEALNTGVFYRMFNVEELTELDQLFSGVSKKPVKHEYGTIDEH